MIKKANNLFKLSFILFSLLFSLILSLKFILHFKYLYYFDIYNLNIDRLSYLNIQDIKTNYNYIIHYLSSNTNINFELPSLPSSKEGIIHFKEVKNIFNTISYLFYICNITLIFFYYSVIKNNNFYIMKICSKVLITLPIITIIILTLNFNNIFTLFHKIMFNNNYWLLDPEKDPIINILPIEFFLHCALGILLLVILQGILLYLLYKLLSIKDILN